MVALTRFDEVRGRARRAWKAARGRIEEGRQGSDEALLSTTADQHPAPGSHGAPLNDAGVPAPEAAKASLDLVPAEASVPRGVRIAAGWSWRLMIIAVAVIGLFYLLLKISNVMVPVIIAFLLSALLQPGASWLRRHGVPRSLAAAIMLVTGIVVVAGVLAGVITAFVQGFDQLSESVIEGIKAIRHWLSTGPLHISTEQLNSGLAQVQDWLSKNSGTLTQGVLSTAATVVESLADLFVILFTTFFLVRDGRGIWNFLLQLLLPRNARLVVDDAGTASWTTLVAYVRATVLVAFIDALGIGIGIKAVGVPWSLAVPLAALVFLGAFIPIVGATVSGAIAVLVTLVTKNLIAAIIVLAVVLAVQQIEGHLLQPLIMGRAVAIHPLGVILSIATGIAIFGIFGGLIAVPFIAVANTAIRRLVARQRNVDRGPVEAAQLPPPQTPNDAAEPEPTA